jgi:hypothetical protein
MDLSAFRARDLSTLARRSSRLRPRWRGVVEDLVIRMLNLRRSLGVRAEKAKSRSYSIEPEEDSGLGFTSCLRSALGNMSGGCYLVKSLAVLKSS